MSDFSRNRLDNVRFKDKYLGNAEIKKERKSVSQSRKKMASTFRIALHIQIADKPAIRYSWQF